MFVRILWVGLLIMLAGCGTVPATPAVGIDETPPAATTVPEGTPAAAASPLDNTKWRLEAYGPENSPLTPVVTTTITLNFAEGKVTGSLGCNSFGGSYTADGQKLIIGQLVQTLMACGGSVDQQEQQIGKALLAVQSYAIAGDTLRLTYPDGVLRYTPVQAAANRSLEGTAWQLSSIVSGAAARSLLANTQITAQFGTGRVAGTAGCNSYSGSYTVQDNTLNIGSDIVSTKKACAADIMQQEQAFLHALAATSSYTIAGNQLTLDNASEQLVFVAQ